MDKKYKIIMIADVPLAKSGVGTQTKYIVDYLVETGKYNIIFFGGAMKHANQQPFRVKEWGDSVTIVPVEGYGNQAVLRQALDAENPDAIWIMTDPRYYIQDKDGKPYLFDMIDEIDQFCPVIYWNIWDNACEETWPRYNNFVYDSCYRLPAINKLTYKFLKENGWDKEASYIPHGVPEDDYRILSDSTISKVKKGHLGAENAHRDFVVFYNSRNAQRKRTGTVMMAFRYFMDMLPEEEKNKIFLMMKTPPKDPMGQDLYSIIEDVPGLKGNVGIGNGDFKNETMNEFYNIADVTISLSSEEGFGLSILESLMCGTPVVCTKTGGMQDQVIDPDTGEEFGFCLEPDARSLIGGQPTPYIWSDHVDPKTAANALYKLWESKKSNDDYKNQWAGERARASMLRRFNMEDMQQRMESTIEDAIVSFKEDKKNKKLRFVEV